MYITMMFPFCYQFHHLFAFVIISFGFIQGILSHNASGEEMRPFVRGLTASEGASPSNGMIECLDLFRFIDVSEKLMNISTCINRHDKIGKSFEALSGHSNVISVNSTLFNKSLSLDGNFTKEDLEKSSTAVKSNLNELFLTQKTIHKLPTEDKTFTNRSADAKETIINGLLPSYPKQKDSPFVNEKVKRESMLSRIFNLNESSPVFNNSSYRFCGVPDTKNSSLHRRVKRYQLEGSKWEKLEITWAVITQTKSDAISHAQVMGDLYAAFKLWSDVSKLTFTEVHPRTPKIDIAIGFYTGDHGDRYPFDGPGRTLAHAFYPGSGGDVHFDDTEPFARHIEAVKSKGTSFLVTAAHELGHSLGLEHSNEYTALMAPFYQTYPEEFELPEDDKRAIQALYGASERGFTPYRPVITTSTTTSTTTISTTTTSTTTTTTRRPYRPPVTPRTTPFRPPPMPITPALRPESPTSRRYPQTTTTTERTRGYPKTTTRSHTYPTTTPYYPNYPPVTDRPVVPAPESDHPTCKPKSTGLYIPDTCRTSFDAITYFRRELYFFKNAYLWRVPMRNSEYPVELKHLGIRALRGVKKVDAAFETPNGKSLVFFIGETFVKSTIAYGTETVERGLLSDLGINNVTQVDAAMIWGHNGYAYVFSGDRYWRLGSDGKVQSDYPRDMSVWQGVPHNISAAVSIGAKTYFFSENVFWPFDNLKMRVENPPRLVSSFFFDCPHPNPTQRQIC